MFGFDMFGIRKGNKIYAELRGGLYLIGLSIGWDKIKKPEQWNNDYKEEVTRLATKPERFVVFNSLKEYAKANGDCIFLCTKKGLYLVNKNGIKEHIETNINNLHAKENRIERNARRKRRIA